MYYCPVNGWDCPYYKDDCICTLENPLMDCDDYAAFNECMEDDSNTIYIFGDI